MLAVAEESSWICRREAVLEIRLGAELDQLPLGKLPPQEKAEAFAKDEASTSAAEIGAGAAAEIEEEHLTFAAGEAFDRHLELAGGGLLEIFDAAGEIPGAVPRLESQTGPAEV